MDERVNIRANGNMLTKDYGAAGTQGEANSTKLVITFAENWDGFAKKITFWNAVGENPVDIQLGANLIEDVATDTRTYIVPVPGEAMTEAGECTFVIEGVTDGVLKRSVEGKLEVIASRRATDAEVPSGVTPDLAAQLRAEIDDIVGGIAEVKVIGAEAREYIAVLNETIETARGYADDAQSSAEASAESAREASYYKNDALDASDVAMAKAGEACEQAQRAEASRQAIEDMSVSSETIGVGEEATVEKEVVDDVVNLHFGIPKGEPGIKIGEGAPPDEVLEDEDVKAWIDLNGEGDDYVTQEELADALNGYVEKTDIDVLQADVEGLQKQINEEAHFRGYLSTNAKIQALEATQNDFAYSAESGTKWVYDDGWKDTGSPVPDQLTPASNATPLINGVATPGQSEEYARGDHRHPTDITRVSVAEFNLLKNDISTALDSILAMQTSYIGGGAE